MISLLLALAGGPTLQAAQATLQSCELTPAGWVCHYKMPPVILRSDPSGAVTASPATPPVAPPAVVPLDPQADAEAARAARLIAKCADAPWYAICLPGERREAKLLKEAADAKAALRREVTGLLAASNCDAAVKKALAAGDLALAREARDFCAAAPKS